MHSAARSFMHFSRISSRRISSNHISTIMLHRNQATLTVRPLYNFSISRLVQLPSSEFMEAIQRLLELNEMSQIRRLDMPRQALKNLEFRIVISVKMELSQSDILEIFNQHLVYIRRQIDQIVESIELPVKRQRENDSEPDLKEEEHKTISEPVRVAEKSPLRNESPQRTNTIQVIPKKSTNSNQQQETPNDGPDQQVFSPTPRNIENIKRMIDGIHNIIEPDQILQILETLSQMFRDPDSNSQNLIKTTSLTKEIRDLHETSDDPEIRRQSKILYSQLNRIQRDQAPQNSQHEMNEIAKRMTEGLKNENRDVIEGLLRRLNEIFPIKASGKDLDVIKECVQIARRIPSKFKNLSSNVQEIYTKWMRMDKANGHSDEQVKSQVKYQIITFHTKLAKVNENEIQSLYTQLIQLTSILHEILYATQKLQKNVEFRFNPSHHGW